MPALCYVPGCRSPEMGNGVCATHHHIEQQAIAHHERHVHWPRMEEAGHGGWVELQQQAQERKLRMAHEATIERLSKVEWVGDGTQWGLAKIRQVIDDLRADVRADGRNNALSRAAFRVGCLVGSDDVRLEHGQRVLREAGEVLGLPPHEVRYVLSTNRDSGPFVRGLRAGSSNTGSRSYRRRRLAA